MSVPPPTAAMFRKSLRETDLIVVIFSLGMGTTPLEFVK
jgi:hypothetical protein